MEGDSPHLNEMPDIIGLATEGNRMMTAMQMPVDELKTRNATGFVNFARVLNAPSNYDSGMWLGGLSFTPIKDLALRLSTYYVPNLLNSTCTDASWRTPLQGDLWLRLSGQYMYQSSTGDDGLTGRGANYNTSFGDFAGYTYGVVTRFNRANENAFMLQANYDFSAHRLPGLAVTAYGAFGNSAINPAAAAARAPGA